MKTVSSQEWGFKGCRAAAPGGKRRVAAGFSLREHRRDACATKYRAARGRRNQVKTLDQDRPM
jgi:hypothetical protein